MSIKEIILELLEKYKDAKESNIWECSGDIDGDIEKLVHEVESYKDKIESYYESVQGTWIPVSERLPESQTNVLVSVHDTTGDTAFDYSSYGWITTDKEYWIVDNEICNYVIAWMPLPEPWKGEQDE